MTFKEKLYARCNQLVDERIGLAKKLIAEAQQAANEDTKSSMGDKYETSREMMALEMRKANEQLQEGAKLNKVLSNLNPTTICQEVEIGSLVSTSIGDFFVSVSLGKINLEQRDIFALSAVAPLGKLLMGKKKGDKFEFNSRDIKINSVM